MRRGDCEDAIHSRHFLPLYLGEFAIHSQGPKGELELNYPDLVEIKKVRN